MIKNNFLTQIKEKLTTSCAWLFLRNSPTALPLNPVHAASDGVAPMAALRGDTQWLNVEGVSVVTDVAPGVERMQKGM